MQLIHVNIGLDVFKHQIDKIPSYEPFIKMKPVEEEQLKLVKPQDMILEHHFIKLYNYEHGRIKNHLQK
jgi:hypothetical protein